MLSWQRRLKGLQVELLEGGALRVQSSTGRGWYRVQDDPEEGGSPAFRRGLRSFKHIVAARQWLKARRTPGSHFR